MIVIAIVIRNCLSFFHSTNVTKNTNPKSIIKMGFVEATSTGYRTKQQKQLYAITIGVNVIMEYTK